MAVEHSTQTFACEVCGCSLVRRHGPAPRFCAACYRERKYQRVKPVGTGACHHCGTSCERKFCSQKCSEDSRRFAFVCPVCGITFNPKRTGVTCCTRECGFKYYRRNKAEAAKIRRSVRTKAKAESDLAKSQRVCVVCGAAFVGSSQSFICSSPCHRERLRAAREAAAGSREKRCVECGSLFVVPYKWGHGARRVCSDKCARRHARRGGRHNGRSHPDRARRRGQGYELGITRVDVFNRDGWRCQLCGKATPKRLLRDYRSKNAPTLDHILPIKAGGSHTWDNLQCACRSCNSRKSSRPLGQTRLF